LPASRSRRSKASLVRFASKLVFGTPLASYLNYAMGINQAFVDAIEIHHPTAKLSARSHPFGQQREKRAGQPKRPGAQCQSEF
jgi:hypothetical protein